MVHEGIVPAGNLNLGGSSAGRVEQGPVRAGRVAPAPPAHFPVGLGVKAAQPVGPEGVLGHVPVLGQGVGDGRDELSGGDRPLGAVDHLLDGAEAQGEEDGQRGEAAVALGRLPLLAPDPAEVGLELDGCCSAVRSIAYRCV